MSVFYIFSSLDQREWHYIASLCWCAVKNLLTHSFCTQTKHFTLHQKLNKNAPCSGVSLMTGSSSTLGWVAGEVTASVDRRWPLSLGLAAGAVTGCWCDGSWMTRGVEWDPGRDGFDLLPAVSAAAPDSTQSSLPVIYRQTGGITMLETTVNPLTPTVAIWVQPFSILCQTRLSRHL